MEIVIYSLVILCCLQTLGDALKSCRPRSSRCRPLTSDDFRCPGRGHFPVSEDPFSYYKCSGPQHEPCRCACKTEQMCFDAALQRCRFAFLDSVRNCSVAAESLATDQKWKSRVQPAVPTSHGNLYREVKAPVLSSDTDQSRWDPLTKVTGKHPNVNEVLKEDNTEQDRLPVSASASPRPVAAGEPTNHTTRPPAARQAANRALPDVIEDDSLFPAWAISLLVLCVVIVFVMVVMVLY